ncbi:MAG TPA: 30S ribosome-binding factor RbfA [Phycisphaerae bacterium]|nr:30S ribosome-binding factor RbfA [Phycisphaerae bacterium]
MSRRTERVGSLIRNEIAALVLSKLSDPRIDPARTSVTKVEVPEDLLTAKVYISVLGTPGEQKRTLDALRHAKGHIQELMSRRVRLRNMPVLEFEVDVDFKSTLDTLELIGRAMNEMRQKQQREEG